MRICLRFTLLFLATAGRAEAEDVAPDPGSLQGGSTHGLEEVRFRFYQSDDRLADFPDEPLYDYQELVQRLHISGGSSFLTLGLQADAVWLFSNEYILDGSREQERALWGEGLLGPHPNGWIGVEKLWLRGQTGQVAWTVGDSYAAFGRGLSLNVVKNTDIDVDTSLRGVHATIATPTVEVRFVEAVANAQQVRIENPNVDMRADRPHAVHAVRADYYGRVHVGGHAVVYQFSRADVAPGNPVGAWGNGLDSGVVGASLEASGVGPFDIGLEGDYFAYNADEIPVKDGGALYGSLAAYPGIASVLVEGKVYRNAEYINVLSAGEGYELVSGPSLEYERAITEDSSAALNSNAVSGGRARVDFNLGRNGGSLAPYVSAAVLRDTDLTGVHFNTTPETVVHALGGVFFVSGELHLLANAGYRMDVRDDAPADNTGDTTIHGDVTLTVPLGHRLSFEVAPNVLRYHWGTNPVQQADYTDVSTTLALKVGAPYALLVYADFSDNPLVNSTGNVTENVYMAGELQWQPTSATTLKLFYGAYRAGIRCAGGQCRTLPGFEGARAALTTHF